MSLLIETIACVDGKLQNLFWHTIRANKSRSILFNTKTKLALDKIPLPNFVVKGKWKCRILYDKKIHGISFEPYVPKVVKTLKIIESNISYGHKFEDRSELDNLYNQRGNADDIIIIKNGLVTDTSIFTVLLFDGRDWVTPETPLLEGTMRAQLISKKVITTKKITQEALFNYQKIMLVNSMNPFDENRSLSIKSSIRIP